MRLVKRNLDQILQERERENRSRIISSDFSKLVQKYKDPIIKEAIDDSSLTWRNIQRLKPKLLETNIFKKITPRMLDPVIKDLGLEWDVSHGARQGDAYINYLESKGKSLQDVENSLRKVLKKRSTMLKT